MHGRSLQFPPQGSGECAYLPLHGHMLHTHTCSTCYMLCMVLSRTCCVHSCRTCYVLHMYVWVTRRQRLRQQLRLDCMCRCRGFCCGLCPWLQPQCPQSPRPQAAPSNAHASVQIWKAWDKPRGFYDKIKQEDEETSKSLLFNAFIFMQVFNEINSRKIMDEYNIFEGIHKSPIFMGVLAITTVLQIIIVQTPVSKIFHVRPLSGAHLLLLARVVYVSVLPGHEPAALTEPGMCCTKRERAGGAR
jgi:hypothetical protein